MARTVAQAMNRGVTTVRPDDTVKHAAIMMEACEIGPLPVCDGDRIVGMVTDRDITTRAVAAGRDPEATTVREVMTAERIVYCRSDQSLDEAVRLMEEHQVRRLPVVDEQKRLVGILALADVARHAGDRAAAQAVKGVSKPTETQQA
jgi:CBS domain-containing protein